MRRRASILVVSLLVFGLVGVALAMQMTGKVTALDAEKGSITVADTAFQGDKAVLSGVKVGDEVTVEYKEEGGKKVATKISAKKKKAAIGC